MADVTGTIRKVTLAGVTYDVFADSNIKAIPSSHENSAIPTSGRNRRKMVKRSEDREGLVLAANGAEQETLKALAEGLEDFTMSYEEASGDVYRATGWIEFEAYETEEGRAMVSMFPRQDWSSFLA